MFPPQNARVAIDFSIGIDFVEPLPDYFAVMLAALILIFAVTLFRVCYALAGSPGAWANFSPLAAILLCSAAYLPRRFILLAALGPLVLADLFLNAHYQAPFFTAPTGGSLFFLRAPFMVGLSSAKQHNHKVLSLFAATLAGSGLFYLITNTASWLSTPDYLKTLPGWWQALTVGLPGFPPTFLFFRNTVLSDIFFTALFVVTQTISQKSRTRTAETASLVVRNHI